MVEPQEPPTFPKPHISDIGQAEQVFYKLCSFFCVFTDVFSDFLATVPILVPSRVVFADGQVSAKLGLNPHCQGWTCW